MIKMITKITVVLLALLSTNLRAQNFQGQAFYQSKTNMDDAFKIESPSLTEEMKKQLIDRMKKQFEKEFILVFNKTESIYEEVQKLTAPTPGSGGMIIQTENSGDGKVYKDIRAKTLLKEADFFGKDFLISDSLQTYKWNISGESKKIGDYTCYKASYTIPVSQKEKDEYEALKKKESDGKTQFFIMNEPSERTITVWYTPDIPVSNGPAEYWGLPGLILEANIDKTTILCSRVVINPKDRQEIKMPKKGKKVTNAEFERLVQEQMEQLNSKQSNTKDGFRIEIHR